MALTVALALGAQGCSKSGCLSGADGCHVEHPCEKVKLTCSETALSVGIIDSTVQRPGGTNALGTKGDYFLKNAFVTVVIAAPGNQNYLDPAGGSILDVAPAGGSDGVNQILTVTGLLPGDAAHYKDFKYYDESSSGRVAVEVKGTLDGYPDVPIYTRYELGPCDTGVRIRTEIVNQRPDNAYWAFTDGYYWSKREPIPFTAGEGQGYTHPSFGLLSINAAFQNFPYLGFNFHNGESASYAAVSCTDSTLEGFNSETVSTAGMAKRLVPPRGWMAFERYLVAVPGLDIDSAARVAMKIREQVLGEKHVTITGKVERLLALTLASEASGNVVISEGAMSTAAEKRTPWSQALPDKDGNFTLTVPTGKSYVLTVDSFGKTAIEMPIDKVSGDTDVGTLTLPSVGSVRFEVTEAGSALQLDAEMYLVAADEMTKELAKGTFHGQYTTCTPWLGAPPGASPACNRVLVRQGVATAEVPAGKYHVYAYHGPFWSLGHQVVTVTPVATTLQFQLTRLALVPAQTVTADLHVHGAASFDSSIPDYDRVLSFAASDLDVIIATDHEVVHDYSTILGTLGLQGRMTAVTGVETTGHVPWMRIPNYGFPLVIGHYIFWPLTYDPLKSRNGAPADEFIEPGRLMSDAEDSMPPGSKGIFQLNHPWAASEFGRDLGFPRALKMDLTKDLPASDDGKDGRGMYIRTPMGSRYSNEAHHAQEVMNGSQNDTLIQYRFLWFYMLNQGRLKTGTANSDSHSLTDNTVGIPRNVIYAATSGGPSFDMDKFNTAIRNGRVLGTSAPIIEATCDGMTGTKDYGLEPFKPNEATGKLKIKVSTAPWAPVSEVRVVVNGQVVKTLPAMMPADPFATTAHVAYDGEVSISDLLTGVTGDAWIVVEASRPLPVAEDLGGGLDDTKDGMPDTTDNNGDGKIDKDDIAKDETYGPIAPFPWPAETDTLFHFANVTDNGFPYAFTNPFVLDRDGNGKFDAPGVKGGR